MGLEDFFFLLWWKNTFKYNRKTQRLQIRGREKVHKEISIIIWAMKETIAERPCYHQVLAPHQLPPLPLRPRTSIGAHWITSCSVFTQPVTTDSMLLATLVSSLSCISTSHWWDIPVAPWYTCSLIYFPWLCDQAGKSHYACLPLYCFSNSDHFPYRTRGCGFLGSS